jgi:hypothetical protein
VRYISRLKARHETVGQKKERLFAMAEFNELSDSKRLESPDFEKKVSGIELNVSGDEEEDAQEAKYINTLPSFQVSLTTN